MIVEFFAPGTPAPQGSKRHVGRGVMIESSRKVRPWRAAVVAAALGATRDIRALLPSRAPAIVSLHFVLARPKSHFWRDGTLKEKAPEIHVSTPDIDKLARSTFDALKDAGVICDDSQIHLTLLKKSYGPTPGCRIEIDLNQN